MRVILGVSVEQGQGVEELSRTVKRAASYVDEVWVFLARGEMEGVIKWCKERGYNYLQLDEDDEGAQEKLVKRLGLAGAEAVLWLDAGDTETRIEQTIIKHLRGQYFKPRVWGKQEICYYANFGGSAIEKWSPRRLNTGLGGSETAVVRLSEEWSKLGWEVTVYGDPGKERGLHGGVRYLPWYEFNIHDYFNIFIQWRGAYRSELARFVSARQYYLDLHDLFEQDRVTPNVHAVDGVMVKSKYHASLAPRIPPERMYVIGNGV